MSLKNVIGERAATAFAKIGSSATDPRLQWSGRPEFGDLQINGVMGLAKELGRNPRELATQILEYLQLADLTADLSVAGPGFINITLSASALAAELGRLQASPTLGIEPPAKAQTIVVDYSAPNLAKEMHVGHLRSTIIGDAVCRLLECKGHRVIRQNHIGDWGTQFGMLLAELRTTLDAGGDADTFSLADLESFYRQAKQHFDEDAEFADRARREVVALQAGDTDSLALWQRFIDESMSHADRIYQRLEVSLTRQDVRGESAYNHDLAPLVDELLASGVAQIDKGAVVVQLPELADKEGNPSVAIIRKADGGFLYATTDLAAMRYRVRELHADRILFFIDARQALHMRQIIAIARRAGWLTEEVEPIHCAFGTMMGEDGRPFKTRSGETVKLNALLDEAVDRADRLVQEKNPDMDPALRAQIAAIVGIGAVKYADLSKARTNDYRFSWESMLSFEGNTAPYLQYACARIHSIFRRAGSPAVGDSFEIVEPQEHALAIALIRYAEVVDQAIASAMPHELCTYLYDLAGKFTTFYEACPMLKADVPAATRESRLALARLSLRTLESGLDLLGIGTLERM